MQLRRLLFDHKPKIEGACTSLVELMDTASFPTPVVASCVFYIVGLVEPRVQVGGTWANA